MAVVDADYKFLYANVGVQGRVPDGGLFAHSDLCKAMDRGLLNIPPPEPLANAGIMMPFMFVGDDVTVRDIRGLYYCVFLVFLVY